MSCRYCGAQNCQPPNYSKLQQLLERDAGTKVERIRRLEAQLHEISFGQVNSKDSLQRRRTNNNNNNKLGGGAGGYASPTEAAGDEPKNHDHANNNDDDDDSSSSSSNDSDYAGEALLDSLSRFTRRCAFAHSLQNARLQHEFDDGRKRSKQKTKGCQNFHAGNQHGNRCCCCCSCCHHR
jgi:hypothetical protein